MFPLLRLISETIDLGVPPKQAVKWWLYIISEAKKQGMVSYVADDGGLHLVVTDARGC
jgi:hypothetical protein